jgi:hypothetical protein
LRKLSECFNSGRFEELSVERSDRSFMGKIPFEHGRMGGVPGIEIAATPEKPAAQTSLPDRVMLESRQVG